MSVLVRVTRRTLLIVGLPVALLVIWWFATQDSDSVYWPPLQSILDGFGTTWLHGRLSTDVLPSLVRLLEGYAIALVVGVGLGVLVGSQRLMRAFLEPVLEFFRAIPPPVVIPVLILLTGIGNTMKVLVIAFGCVWPIVLNAADGVRAIDLTLRDTARNYQLGPWARLVHLTLPGASPRIAAGARQALAVALLLMVISEMFAATDGVGYAVIQFQRNYDIPEMWSGIILLGLMGVVLAAVFRLVELRVLRWYYGWLHAQEGRG